MDNWQTVLVGCKAIVFYFPAHVRGLDIEPKSVCEAAVFTSLSAMRTPVNFRAQMDRVPLICTAVYLSWLALTVL